MAAVASGAGTSKGFSGGGGGGLTDQQMDELIRNEDASFDQNHNAISKEQLLGSITDLPAYKVDEQAFDCPELESNPIY